MTAGSAGISSRWRRLGQSKRLCTACGRGHPLPRKFVLVPPSTVVWKKVESMGAQARGWRGGGGGNNRYLGPMG